MQLVSRGLLKKTSAYSGAVYMPKYYSTSGSGDGNAFTKVLSFDEFKASRQKLKEKQSLLDKLNQAKDSSSVDQMLEIKTKLSVLDREIDRSVKSFSVQTPEQKDRELAQWKEFIRIKGIRSQSEIKALNRYEFERWKQSGLLDEEARMMKQETSKAVSSAKSSNEKAEEFVQRVAANVSMAGISEYNVHERVEETLIKMTRDAIIKAREEGKPFNITAYVNAATAALYQREMSKPSTHAQMEVDNFQNMLEAAKLKEERRQQLLKERGVVTEDDYYIMGGKLRGTNPVNEKTEQELEEIKNAREFGLFDMDGTTDQYKLTIEGRSPVIDAVANSMKIQEMNALLTKEPEEFVKVDPVHTFGLDELKGEVYGINMPRENNGEPDFVKSDMANVVYQKDYPAEVLEAELAKAKEANDYKDLIEKRDKQYDDLIQDQINPVPPKGMLDLLQEAKILHERDQMIQNIRDAESLSTLPEVESDFLARQLKRSIKEAAKKEAKEKLMNDEKVKADNMRNFIKYKFDKERMDREQIANEENKKYNNQLEVLQQGEFMQNGKTLGELYGKHVSPLDATKEQDELKSMMNPESSSGLLDFNQIAGNTENEPVVMINPRNGKRFRPNKKHPKCLLCQSPHWRVEAINIPFLKLYLNKFGDILPRYYSGNCAKHQRKISKTIRQAKALGLINYKKGFAIIDPNEYPLTPQEQIEEEKYRTLDLPDEELEQIFGKEIEMSEEQTAEAMKKDKEMAILEYGLEASEVDSIFG